LAAKLVEANQDVLLLEAGGEYHSMNFLRIDIWRWLSNIFSLSLWDFVTSRQKVFEIFSHLFSNKKKIETCFFVEIFFFLIQFANNRAIWASRGKTTGGSSAVNGCMWVRGCSQDYDRWADVAG
jgi:choline dehydrogenase-like flavoprotein